MKNRFMILTFNKFHPPTQSFTMNKHSFFTKTSLSLSFAATRLAVFALLCLIQSVWADNADGIKTVIDKVTGGNNLDVSVSGNTVTVTGTLGATPSNADYLTLDIDAGVTVTWQASLAGTPSSSYSLININGGSGTFLVSSGSIENTGTGRAITNSSASTIRISGTVKANGGYAIYNSSSGNITVSSGTVSATSGYAIYNYSSTGNITVSGGTVSATSGTAIYNSNSSTGNITVSGGTVSTSITNGNSIYYAIYNGQSSSNITVSSGTVKSENSTAIYNSGTLSVSGGTVSATSGYAIYNNTNGTTTISGNAKITSAGPYNGTIYNRNGVTLNINGGTVENTATSTSSNGNNDIVAIDNEVAMNNVYLSTINVSGGTVSATSGNAIYGGTVNISGGTVRTSGNSKSAVYNYSGSVKITGGTVSATQSNGYGVWNGSSATLTLGNNPAITGRIYTYPEKLSVITTAPDIFNSGSRVYTLDFPEAQYAAYKIAVMNGASFYDNFKLYNPDWALNVAGQHLSIIKAVKVSFDLNGGIYTPPATIGVPPGSKVQDKPPTSSFTRNGYTNDGEWYTSAMGTTTFVFGENGTLVDQDMILYLKWTPIAYTVTFVNHDGTKLSQQTVTYGSAATAPTNPIREDYIFIGWDKEFDNVTDDIIVNAVYEDATPIINSISASGFGMVLNGANFQIVGTSQVTPISIYNLHGKIIMTRTAMPNESISLTYLPKGIYIVKASFGSEKQILRIPVR
jgi:hypothetical protein